MSLSKTEYDATGSAIKPEPELVYGGYKLIKDTDYTLSYQNNTKPGTATVTATPKAGGMCAGDPQSLNFTIVLAKLKD